MSVMLLVDNLQEQAKLHMTLGYHYIIYENDFEKSKVEFDEAVKKLDKAKKLLLEAIELRDWLEAIKKKVKDE